MKICDRIETSPTPLLQDQSQSYQVTYGAQAQQQQQQPIFTRPTAAFADQTLVKTQGYQTQPNILSEKSFKTVDTYGSSAKTFSTDEVSQTSWTSPYGQTSNVNIEQTVPVPQFSFVPQQQAKPRTLVRVFQPETLPSRNLVSTQSGGYRRRR